MSLLLPRSSSPSLSRGNAFDVEGDSPSCTTSVCARASRYGCFRIELISTPLHPNVPEKGMIDKNWNVRCRGDTCLHWIIECPILAKGPSCLPSCSHTCTREREFLINNLLVRIHRIIDMTALAPRELNSLVQVALYLNF